MRKKLIACCRPVASPRTPQWYQARKTGIGSSEAAEAVGRSQWRTPLDLYLRKVGTVPEFQGNTHTRIGTALEPVLKQLFAEQLHKEIADPSPPMFRSKGSPFVLATCDALVGDKEVLETKWTSGRFSDAWGDQTTDQIPEETILQVQQQLYVTGRERGWVGVLVEADFRVYLVERTDELIAWLVGEEKVFWEKVLDREPPPPDPDHKASLRAVRALYGSQIEPIAIRLSPAADALRKRLAGLREAEAAIGREIDQIKTSLFAELGTAEFGLGDDGGAIKREFRKACEYTVKREESVILKAVSKLPKRLLLKGD